MMNDESARRKNICARGSTAQIAAMAAGEILERIRNIPGNERRELVQQILDEFTEYDDELTPEQISELDRRAEDALKNPGRGIPFEQIHEEMKAKYGWK